MMTLNLEDEDELERVISHNLAKGDWDISRPTPWIQELASGVGDEDDEDNDDDGKEGL